MRRVIAGVAAVLLAAIGAVLVFVYADRADERAAADQQTREVAVAEEFVPSGTPVSEFGDAVRIRQLPDLAILDGALSSLDDVQDQVLAVDLVPGEQVVASRLLTEEQLRARGATTLPEEVEDDHQVTLLLDKERALGGDIAPGDTVGVFMSFDIESDPEDVAIQAPEGGEGAAVSSDENVSVTDLVLHRVPVLRVEGAFVPAPAAAGEDDQDDVAEDRVFVTLAVDPPDAARLVYGMEWGRIWLSLEPEGASDEDVPTVVITPPTDITDVLQ